MSSEAHISAIIKKIGIGIFQMKQLSQCVDDRVLLKTYYAFVYSHMNYGTSIWGNAPKSDVTKIFNLQKKAIRILAHIPSDQTCRGEFKKQNILTVSALYIVHCILYVIYNIDKITLNCNHHEYNTRQKNDIHVNFYREGLP